MLPVILEGRRVKVADRFSMSFQRTLRVPEDGRRYPLPPGLGAFPLHDVAECRSTVPAAWRAPYHFLIPMYQREALWIGFDGAWWKPNAVSISMGSINALTGKQAEPGLHHPQDYLVCPNQPWIAGFHVKPGVVRQFVAMPLGSGYTVEEQLSCDDARGVMSITVYEPKSGRFPDRPPAEPKITSPVPLAVRGFEMGLAAGGQITQKLYPDPYGLDVWDQETFQSVFLHIVNSEQFRRITGREPPSTPIDMQTYAAYGFPWFELCDEHLGDIESSDRLATTHTVGEVEAASGGTIDEGGRSSPSPVSRLKTLRHRAKGKTPEGNQ